MSKSILKKDTINKIYLSILLISILFLLTLTTLVIGLNMEVMQMEMDIIWEIRGLQMFV